MNEQLAAVLLEWSNRIREQVMDKWATKGASIKGNAEAHEAILSVTFDGIVAKLGFSGQAAWIAEYGRGSLMDANNPYLDNYKSNSNYNPSRSGLAISGRPAGAYTDLDGTPYNSKGGKEGQVLEGQSPRFEPSLPLHIISQEIESAIPEITVAITNVITKSMMLEISNAISKRIEL